MKKSSHLIKTIGDKFRDDRYKNELSLAQMGALLGVSGTQVSYYELKNVLIKYKTIEKYAKALGRKPQEYIKYAKIIQYPNSRRIGDILKKERIEKNKTMEQVCKEMNISFMSLYRYENALNKYIRSDTVEKFEKYYKMKKGELLNGITVQDKNIC